MIYLNGSIPVSKRFRHHCTRYANLFRNHIRLRIRLLPKCQLRRLQRTFSRRFPLHATPHRYPFRHLGFGLLTVYLKEYTITGLALNFIMLAFTIQWYFLMKKFWYAIKLTDSVNNIALSDNPYNIRLSTILKYYYNVNDPFFALDVQNMKYFTLSQAICCAISMFVIIFPLLGRIGPAEALVISFFGNAGYTLNEAIFWRLNINDNGYGMKIFLFGSVAGIVASFIIGR